MATIRKRGKTYQIRVSCGYSSEGEQVTKTTTYKPAAGMTEKQIEKEVRRQAVIFEERCKNGLYGNGNVKLSEFIEKWFTDYAEKKLKVKTLKRYKELSVRVNAALGHFRLDKLQPLHLIEFYNSLQEENKRLDTKYRPIKDIRSLLKKRGITQAEFCKKAGVSESVMRAIRSGGNVSADTAKKIDSFFGGSFFRQADGATTLSNATVRYYHAFLSTVLSCAVKWQVIVVNPCERVEAPKVERKEAAIIDEQQTAELLKKLETAPLNYRTAITLILFSGMRRSEVLGLEWSDIDFENNLVNIDSGSLYTPEKGIYTDTPKNKTSERVIKIPVACIQLLKEHRKKQIETRLLMGDQWQESGRIFTQRNGKPMHPDTLTAWFKKFLSKNKMSDTFPDIHIHSLRHTNASLLIANGTDIRTVAKRLGHSTATTTANIYAHAIRTADEMAADTLGDLFFGKQA